MTFHDIIQKNMESFDEKFGQFYVSIDSKTKAIRVVDIENGIKVNGEDGSLIECVASSDIKKFLLSSQLSIIQAIDELIEEVIKNKEQVNGFQPYHKCSDNCGEPCWLAGSERKVFFDGFDDGRNMMKIDLMKVRSFLKEAKTK